jgi:hypothetical protein
MEIMKRLTDKEFSQKKLEEYANWEKIVQYGRQNPIWFMEWAFGASLMDFQKWIFMNCWYRPFCLLLCCRGAGKTVEASLLHMSKMLLIPNWKQYVASNSLAQSIEVFKKIEDIALNRIPSFKSLTDIFAEEVYKTPNCETGFVHDPKGHTFRLFNNSELLTLSSNMTTARGKRGSVHFDESAWMSEEMYAILESFINVDTSFGLGVDADRHIEPRQIPLQLLYTSSASDCESHYFQIFKKFSMKQMLGNPNYFVADLTADAITKHSSVNGKPIKSHLTQAQIDKAIEDNPELAERELFNHFRKGSGANAVVKLETLMHNSESRVPLLYNDTSKKKFIFCYDPARSFDNSVLSIFQLIEDEDIGYYLRLENVITMVDTESRNKTPLSMNEQIKIIQKQMLRYNGDKAAEWENIQFYIDAGAGGQALSVCDQLLDDWVDDKGIKHRGIIDAVHKQYETARKKYPLAMPIVHLIDPQPYKKIIYTAVQEMCMLNLIKFTEYDGKDELSYINENGEIETHELNKEEKLALLNIELAKNELSYMCRYETPNGGVQFELERDKRNKMHDDRAYTMALGGYALSTLRRHDLITIQKPVEEELCFFGRAAKSYK